MPLKILPLTESFELGAFDCGDSPRNAWLRNRALANQVAGDSRTYVATGDERTILGFHAQATGSIIRQVLPGALRRNAPDPVSCILLVQLAVAKSHHGTGLGRTLVLHAMRQTVAIADLVGCRLFAVHPATPDLVGYYARFGFQTTGTEPALMAMSLSKLRVTLASLS